MGDTWITDLSHFDGIDADVNASRKAKRMATFFRGVATDATMAGTKSQYSMTRQSCRRRPNRKPCTGRILVRLQTDRQIEWRCSQCDDNGLISNWWGRLAGAYSEMGYPLPLEPELFGVLKHVARDTQVEPRLAALEPNADGEREISLPKDWLNDLWTLTDVDQAVAGIQHSIAESHQLFAG